MKYKYLLLLLLVLPLISGCDRSDDVAGIFTGKTWKLTYITKADSKPPYQYNFWGNAETLKKALDELNKSGAYTITFTGMESDDIIEGKFEGTLGGTSTFNGSWQADGKSNDFSTSSVRFGSNQALLDSYFKYGIENAKRYKGNYDNLHLYYTTKEGVELQMSFHVVK